MKMSPGKQRASSDALPRANKALVIGSECPQEVYKLFPYLNPETERGNNVQFNNVLIFMTYDCYFYKWFRKLRKMYQGKISIISHKN